MAQARQEAKAQEDRTLYRQLSRQQRQLPAGDPHDPNYRRLRYTRYADDFLLGLIGSKAEAEAIKANVGQYLNSLELTLSKDKTYVTHASTDSARFLGYEITMAWENTKLTTVKGTKIRSLNGTIQLRVPNEAVRSWLRRYMEGGSPSHIGGYVELSDFEIVETFGAQLRGLITYYALASNLNAALGKVRWACIESARKTLAAKHTTR
ncbi:MAG: group II intron reverse transcriptase/maturase, partial [Candidatus Tectomicrobia bacterium]